MCTCSYDCGSDDWRDAYSSGETNVTIADACGAGRRVTCEVQADFETCICEGGGRSGGETNVTNCRFHELVSPFLWFAALLGTVAAATLWLMFKLGQYSPKSDRVRIGESFLCCLPKRGGRAAEAVFRPRSANGSPS